VAQSGGKSRYTECCHGQAYATSDATYSRHVYVFIQRRRERRRPFVHVVCATLACNQAKTPIYAANAQYVKTLKATEEQVREGKHVTPKPEEAAKWRREAAGINQIAPGDERQQRAMQSKEEAALLHTASCHLPPFTATVVTPRRS